jgi:cell division protein FtsX
MNKTFSVLLKTLGVILITLAVVFGWASFNSFMERINHGSGLMFADAEIFLVLMFFFLFIGILCFWIERKLNTNSHN